MPNQDKKKLKKDIMEVWKLNKFAIEDVEFSSSLHYKWREQEILYYNPQITFREIPNEISLTIPTLCYNHCSIDCNSKFCWVENCNFNTKSLSLIDLVNLIQDNKGISCVTIMTSTNFNCLDNLLRNVKLLHPKLKTALYIGVNWEDLLDSQEFKEFDFSCLDYIKIGKFDIRYGGLDKSKTNQKFYKIHHYQQDTVFERNILECCNELFRESFL